MILRIKYNILILGGKNYNRHSYKTGRDVVVKRLYREI